MADETNPETVVETNAVVPEVTVVETPAEAVVEPVVTEPKPATKKKKAKKPAEPKGIKLGSGAILVNN